MRDNKQFIAAVAFFVFIAVALVGLLVYDGKDKDKNNKEEVVATEEKVQDAKTVKVVTSNPNYSNSNPDYSNSNSSTNSNSRSSSNSSTNNNSKSNKKSNTSSYIPISYFITELIENKIYVGNQTRVKVTIKPDNATTKEVTYKSQDPTVATVDSNGVIKGISPGICYIDVNVKDAGGARVEIQVISKPKASNSNSKSNSSSNSKTNSNTNTNTNSNSRTNSNSNSNKTVNVTGVALSQNKLGLKVGKQASLVATVVPSNASNKSVTWTTTNPSVATVSSNGVVTAKGQGTATITVITKNGGKKATCTVTVSAPKNGWVTEGGNKYYYVNDVKQTNKYVNYIYLNANGVAQPKIGSFSVTIYGAQGWASADVKIRKTANMNAESLGIVPESSRVTILDTDSNNLIKIKYNNITGYIPTAYLFINLPDVMPYVVYDISNANKSIFKVAGKNIPNVTGKNLYGYSAKYNSKIGKTTYYAPLLYPVAKKFQVAFNNAWKNGYTFRVYDTYRPRPVEELVSRNYSNLYNNNSTVKKAVDYDKQGNYWGWGWFMTTTGTSRHCQGIALDLALANKNGKVLGAQSTIHTLDTSSLRKYNNSNANTLSNFMTGAGFSTLQSEWWHFEDNTYKNNPYETFYIK